VVRYQAPRLYEDDSTLGPLGAAAQ
jgi:hypothetical protein